MNEAPIHFFWGGALPPAMPGPTSLLSSGTPPRDLSFQGTLPLVPPPPSLATTPAMGFLQAEQQDRRRRTGVYSDLSARKWHLEIISNRPETPPQLIHPMGAGTGGRGRGLGDRTKG